MQTCVYTYIYMCVCVYVYINKYIFFMQTDIHTNVCECALMEPVERLVFSHQVQELLAAALLWQ